MAKLDKNLERSKVFQLYLQRGWEKFSGSSPAILQEWLLGGIGVEILELLFSSIKIRMCENLAKAIETLCGKNHPKCLTPRAKFKQFKDKPSSLRSPNGKKWDFFSNFQTLWDECFVNSLKRSRYVKCFRVWFSADNCLSWKSMLTKKYIDGVF